MENKFNVENFNTGAVMDLLNNASFEQGEEEKHLEELAQAAAKNDTQKVIDYERFRKTRQVIREYEKIGRNDPCPCGSGKKYKNCCMDSGKYEKNHELNVTEAYNLKTLKTNISEIRANLHNATEDNNN